MSDKEKIIQLAGLIDDPPLDHARISQGVAEMIAGIGENPEREGLRRTPERVADMFGEILDGYRIDPEEMLSGSVFEVNYDEMVLVRDIEFYSLCEHHMLPFIGRVHVAYIPRGRVIGLSKIPRIVDMFARRLQVQERMTSQIADFLTLTLEPRGVGVVVEALHLCMMMRGVRKHDARMTTTSLTGLFRKSQATRQEFLDSISRGASPLSI